MIASKDFPSEKYDLVILGSDQPLPEAALGRAVDWLVGDAAVIPPDEERHYCERIVRDEGLDRRA